MLRIIIALCSDFTGVHRKFEYKITSYLCKTFLITTKFVYIMKIRIVISCIVIICIVSYKDFYKALSKVWIHCIVSLKWPESGRNLDIFTFRTYAVYEKYCNHAKIPLWDFDIFIFILRSLVFTYTIFTVMYVCMCVCVCVCVRVKC